MMKRFLVACLTTFLLVIGLGWFSIRPAYASTKNTSIEPVSPFFSQLDLQDPGDLYQYEPFLMQGTLTDWTGNGIAGAQIVFHLDGVFFHQVQTNGDGSFQLNVLDNIPEGTHRMDIYFPGTQNFDPSSASMSVKIQPNVKIALDGLQQVALTEPLLLTGYIWDYAANLGVPTKSLTFSVNGSYIGQAHTDDQGAFQARLQEDLPAGKYTVTAYFKGMHKLSPALATFEVEIMPATVQVQTVPAIGGISFEMDGQQFTSGADGFAYVKIGTPGTHQLHINLDNYSNPSMQVEFGRWMEETFDTVRDVTVPSDKPVQVGLNVSHQVSLKFYDLEGLPVNPARIDSISIRSTQGDAYTLKPGDTPWLPASRTARRLGGLEETDLLYSVNSVVIDGSNVVNAAQQRFYAKPEDIWKISLLLYSLQVTSKDALFAAPVGNSVSVSFPDGQSKTYPLDRSGGVEIHTLARGIYRVSLLGSRGLGTTMPVALSRNQSVNLRIVTMLDLAVVGSIFLGFAVGLILVGRPWLLRMILRRKLNTSRKMRWNSMHEN